MTIALIGEARGEFLFLQGMADRIRSRLGAESVIHVEMDPRDLSPAERRSCLVPALEPPFQTAAAIPDDELPSRVAEAEARLGIPNLRRLWLQDILHWRDHVPETELARQALGYVAVFDELYARRPELAGGFAEESARMIKRIFRAVSLHHGRRMVISITVPTGRIVLVDQEEFDEGMPSWTAFVPTPEELRDAQSYVDDVRSGTIPFGAPRNLQVTPRRLATLARLASRSVRPRSPGDANLRPTFFLRDFVQQRARVAGLRATATKSPPARPAVLYPLHASFDSQLTIRGEAYRNQVALAEQLADSLPYGFDLWVKPHPFAADIPLRRLVALQRRVRNLELVHPQVPLRALLRRVAALVTINSTAGFEALAAGVPVVALGRSHYSGRGLTHDVASTTEFPYVLPRAIHGSPPDRSDVERLIAYLNHAGYGMPMMGADGSMENAARFGDAVIDHFGLDQRGRTASTSAARSTPPSVA